MQHVRIFLQYDFVVVGGYSGGVFGGLAFVPTPLSRP